MRSSLRTDDRRIRSREVEQQSMLAIIVLFPPPACGWQDKISNIYLPVDDDIEYKIYIVHVCVNEWGRKWREQAKNDIMINVRYIYIIWGVPAVHTGIDFECGFWIEFVSEESSSGRCSWLSLSNRRVTSWVTTTCRSSEGGCAMLARPGGMWASQLMMLCDRERRLFPGMGVRVVELDEVDEVDVSWMGCSPLPKLKFRRSSSRESGVDRMMVKLYPIPKNITVYC